MKKRMFFSHMFVLLSMTCFANFEKDGYSMYIEDGGICLSSVNGEVAEELVVPDSIEFEGKKYPVRKLGGQLFEFHNEIRKATIPATVTSMGTGVFGYCSNLKEIVVEEGEGVIDCYNISTFSHSPIERLYLGRELNNLWMDSLKYLTIGAKVKKISCDGLPRKLVSIIIEDSDQPCAYNSDKYQADTIYIGRNMVRGKESSYDSAYGAFTGECNCLKIGTNITEIDRYCFNNFWIRDIIIPASVKNLRRKAFNHCYIKNMRIESSTIPLNIESYDAFYRAEIDSLYLGRELKYTDDFYGAFTPRNWYNPIQNLILKYVYMEDNVTNLNRAAFQYCKALSYIRFSPFVETLPQKCFQYCIFPQDLIWPEALKNIDDYAFSNSSVIIADFNNTQLETIGVYAFYEAGSLSKIVLPATIKQIGFAAFASCPKLSEIIIHSEQLPTIGEYAFYKTATKNIILRVPEKMIDLYKADPVWGEINNIVPLETDGIVTITNQNANKKRAYNIDGTYYFNGKKIVITPTTKGYKKYIKQ